MDGFTAWPDWMVWVAAAAAGAFALTAVARLLEVVLDLDAN
jgi:hypothetical protein